MWPAITAACSPAVGAGEAPPTAGTSERWTDLPGTCSSSEACCSQDWDMSGPNTDMLPASLAKLVAQRRSLHQKDPQQLLKQGTLHSPALGLGRGLAWVNSSLSIAPAGLEAAFWSSSSRFLVQLDAVVLAVWLLNMVRVLPQNLAAAHSFGTTMVVFALQVLHLGSAAWGRAWYLRWREHLAMGLQFIKIVVFMRTWAARDLSAPEHSLTFTVEFVLLWCALVQVMFLSGLSIIIRFKWRAPLQTLLLAFAITKSAPGAAALLGQPHLYAPLAAAGARACARVRWAAQAASAHSSVASVLLQPALQWTCEPVPSASAGSSLFVLVVALQLLVGFFSTLCFLYAFELHAKQNFLARVYNVRLEACPWSLPRIIGVRGAVMCGSLCLAGAAALVASVNG